METAIDLIIESQTRQLLDDFKVRRVLPHRKRRMIGAFIFLDQMGPEILDAGRGLDVAPHPHIGLATVTYLFRGELLHRDSLGSIQTIRPGEINWMTAGRGIAHSERTPDHLRKEGEKIYGIQTWVALPEALEEGDPEFFHHPQKTLPFFEGEGKQIRLLAGKLFGQKSPVRTASEMIYADLVLEKRARFSVPQEFEERAIYVVEGQIEFASQAGETHGAGRLLVLKPEEEMTIRAAGQDARLLLLGGEPLGQRHIWWNFVSSSRERIEQAKRDWREQRFDRVPEEKEYIPLPGESDRATVYYP